MPELAPLQAEAMSWNGAVCLCPWGIFTTCGWSSYCLSWQLTLVVHVWEFQVRCAHKGEIHFGSIQPMPVGGGVSSSCQFGWHSHGFLAQRSLHSRVVSRNCGTHRAIFTRRTSSSHYKTATSFEKFARSWIPFVSCGSGDNCKQNDLCECCYMQCLITFRNDL